MNAIRGPGNAATPGVSAGACAHCGRRLAVGQGLFCCTGCEGAHALVNRLGLDAFYARRALADGSLRPEDEEARLDYAPLVREDGDGVRSLELMVSGLTCGACVWLIEQALAAEPDVQRARVSLTARRLTVAWQGDAARANDFAVMLGRLGFRVAPWSPACLRATEDAESRALIRALGIACFGASNVMLVSVAVWVGFDMGPAARNFMHWLAALIGLPTVMVAGMPFYRSAIEGLHARRLNMDFAVSLGVLATTAMSLSETMRNGPYTYFDGATVLLAILLAGRVLDRLARGRARKAVAELLALQEGTVSRLDGDGLLHAVPVEDVRAGDRLMIAAGERLRLDGRAEGKTLLDVSATTGESLPRGFAEAADLPAGAINMGAPFVLTVTAAARDGSVAAMARLLERAEQARGRFVSIADKAARFYVPAAHVVAGTTFFVWFVVLGVVWQEALVHAVAVLLITCPCALAIAIPAVQVVSVGGLFRRGVLVASPTALERLASADRVVLDKTGTLTEGRPELQPGAHDPALLRAAASMARASRHPLAQALVRACPAAPAAEGVVEHPGRGLERDGVRLGSAPFCGVAGDDVGMTMWFAAPGAEPVAFRFADRQRIGAAESVAALEELGLRAEILSGDGAVAVEAAAEDVGVAEWRANQTPEDKAARIQLLRDAGYHPLMVGDGLNDAAALALAHVSASPAGATDLAQTTSDIVLQRAGLSALPAAIVIARRAQSIAKQNIALSFVYNAIAVPVAAFGFATPLIAALGMAGSSVIVILNALRADKEG